MYTLKTVLDELEGGGMVTTDDELVIETLNNDLGLNIHHDIVLISQEVETLRCAATQLHNTALLFNLGETLRIADAALEVLGE